ncbi:MAG: lipoyl(octanoyl) transferase LipB [Ferruginibacter sp.]|nr:lipoyl(octanoyl) transferase LipB [Ferruginibacter sp.]MBU9936728.1 lipoyl(octanoyl) transferase LipB [Ferruginibacter sp.]
MDKQTVIFKDLGIIEYKTAWDLQEELLQENVRIKAALRSGQVSAGNGQLAAGSEPLTINHKLQTTNFFLLCEHPPVYTLGKSGKKENVLMSDDELAENNIAFFNTNRGGDITFHGLQQIVGYPILDLEKYTTDIGRYLRDLEELVILTLAEYGIKGERSKGETGVWIDAGIPGRERKICAIGVRCSRWITMHGFALNVNTDLGYFNNIIPCGIQNKQVTSIEKELGHRVNYEEAKEKIKRNFERVFHSVLH